MKDVEANPDFTSQLLKEKLASKQEESTVDVKTEPKVEEETSADVQVKKLWYEAQSVEGHTYYWHIETGGG